MKLKKAFISNIDIIQVSNFATVSSVTNSHKFPKNPIYHSKKKLD